MHRDSHEESVHIPTNLEHAAELLARREMVLPILLLISGHRPLAFVVGQLLYLLEPLGAWVFPEDWSSLALLLSHPHGLERLEDLLQSSLTPSQTGDKRSIL